MKRVDKKKLQRGESYLVFIGYEWSPSGYDICKWDGKELSSHSNNEDVLEKSKAIFELPIDDF